MAANSIDEYHSIRRRQLWDLVQQQQDAANCCTPAVQAPAPCGVGAVQGGLNTPEVNAVLANRPVVPLVERNRTEILADIQELAEKDPIEWEEMMLSFYKLQVAFADDNMKTCSAELQYFQECAARLYEKRQKEYDQIFNRLQQNIWLDGVGAAGTAAGGIFVFAAAIAAGATGGALAIPALIAAASIAIAAMQLDGAFGKPVEKAIDSYLPAGTFGVAETILTITSSLVLAFTNKANPISLIANGVSSAGKGINKWQDGYSEQRLERVKSDLQLNKQAMDELKEFLRLIFDGYSRDTTSCREMLRQQYELNKIEVR